MIKWSLKSKTPSQTLQVRIVSSKRLHARVPTQFWISFSRLNFW